MQNEQESGPAVDAREQVSGCDRQFVQVPHETEKDAALVRPIFRLHPIGKRDEAQVYFVRGTCRRIRCCCGGTFYAWESPLPPIDPRSARATDRDKAKRGASLALLGVALDVPYGARGSALAPGGLAMQTPFGTIFSTNITPDPETGIGRWSEQAFIRALRAGLDREGRHLYPAFPRSFHARVGRRCEGIVRLLHVPRSGQFLDTAERVSFPLNVRLTLDGWKLLFLRQARIRG